jgi:hypothetical protein
MTIRKASSALLIAAFLLAGLPASGQTFAPNTIWGQVPQGLAGNVASVELVDAAGNVVATAPLINGRFEFPNVTPGDYTVRLVDASNGTIVTSPRVTLVSGDVVKVQFTGDKVAGAAAPGGGGPSKTMIVAGGAAVIGVGTAIVLYNRHHGNNPASPKR